MFKDHCFYCRYKVPYFCQGALSWLQNLEFCHHRPSLEATKDSLNIKTYLFLSGVGYLGCSLSAFQHPKSTVNYKAPQGNSSPAAGLADVQYLGNCYRK